MKESSNQKMQENKPVLELKNTEKKVCQELKWKKNISHCTLINKQSFQDKAPEEGRMSYYDDQAVMCGELEIEVAITQNLGPIFKTIFSTIS